MKQIRPIAYAYKVHWIDGSNNIIWGNDQIDELLKPRWEKCERIPACGFEPINELDIENKRVYDGTDVIYNPDFCYKLKEFTSNDNIIGSIAEIKFANKIFKFKYVGSTDIDIQFKEIKE